LVQFWVLCIVAVPLLASYPVKRLRRRWSEP